MGTARPRRGGPTGLWLDRYMRRIEPRLARRTSHSATWPSRAPRRATAWDALIATRANAKALRGRAPSVTPVLRVAAIRPTSSPPRDYGRRRRRTRDSIDRSSLRSRATRAASPVGVDHRRGTDPGRHDQNRLDVLGLFADLRRARPRRRRHGVARQGDVSLRAAASTARARCRRAWSVRLGASLLRREELLDRGQQDSVVRPLVHANAGVCALGRAAVLHRDGARGLRVDTRALRIARRRAVGGPAIHHAAHTRACRCSDDGPGTRGDTACSHPVLDAVARRSIAAALDLARRGGDAHALVEAQRPAL